MCNPRRVQVTATRQLEEAWQHEVERTVEVTGRVAGEARARQPLDATLGGPTARALEDTLAADGSGWTAVDGGYRYDVEGGYALYHADDRALEVVAVVEEELRATGTAVDKLAGRTARDVTAVGEGHYDPGWDNRTEEMAKRDAEAAAAKNLDAAGRAAVEADRKTAEAAADPALRAAADADAQKKLARQAADRKKELAEQATRRLTAVGLRAREAFHQALGRAYRDAILAYARKNQADGVRCAEEGGVIDIEFHVQR